MSRSFVVSSDAEKRPKMPMSQVPSAVAEMLGPEHDARVRVREIDGPFDFLVKRGGVWGVTFTGQCDPLTTQIISREIVQNGVFENDLRIAVYCRDQTVFPKFYFMPKNALDHADDPIARMADAHVIYFARWLYAWSGCQPIVFESFNPALTVEVDPDQGFEGVFGTVRDWGLKCFMHHGGGSADD